MTRSTEILDKGGYFDAAHWIGGTGPAPGTPIFALESMGIRVEYSHHEVAPTPSTRSTCATRMP